MKLLLVSATPFEIEPCTAFLKNFKTENVSVKICITGVGMVNTAFELGKLHHEKFDLVINAGIAGSFNKHNIGDVVQVNEDCFSEMGAEDGGKFLSIDELGFAAQCVKLNSVFENDFTKQIKTAKGITVNTVHGNEQSIASAVKKHNPDIETMESAAFIHAANANNWKALQLRAVSNQVEKRNKGNWNIPLAIKNLNETLIELLKDICR
ncbi:MAG: futalosine hydrolase [Bacteroidetes bacterium]|nr:futalosine hydrolase [Bacteroidota bacterium]